MAASKAMSRAKGAHWTLLACWVLVLFGVAGGAGAWAMGAILWAKLGILVAALAMALLLIRFALAGYLGYERTVGLRIIWRDPDSRKPLRRLLVTWSIVLAGVALLVGFAHVWDGAAFMSDPDWKPVIDNFRLSLVSVVAAASLYGLLLLVGRRFSVFGTASIFGVVIGVAALVVVQSVATGFQHEFERRVLGVYAHINVTRAFGIPEYRRFEAWLRTVPGVTGASPFVYYPMALAPYDPEGKREGDIALASVLVKGIEPSTADQVIEVVEHLERGSGHPVPLDSLRSDYKLMPVPDAEEALPDVIANTPDPRGKDWYPKALEEWRKAKDAREAAEAAADPNQFLRGEGPGADDWGEWEDAPDSASGVVAQGLDTSTLPTMFVGYILARKLQLESGDVVRLVDPGSTFDSTKEPEFTYYVIAGVFQAGFQEYDDHLVYIDIKELQRFKFDSKDTVSGVDLRLTDANIAPEVGAAIRTELGDSYSVFEWQLLNENLFSSIETQKNIITIILSLVIFVASFNVLAALWTMTVRRTAEIAILMSMGSTGPQIARIFQVTGLTIGLAGSLAGVLFGLVMCGLVELFGYGLDPEVYFIEELPVEISAVQIAWILALSLGFCFVATIPPALKAARLRPVEGLRFG